MLKALLLAPVLLAVSFSAAAQWVRLGVTQTSTFYFDPSSIQSFGDTVKMKYLVDHDKRPVIPGQKNPYESAINLSEYDCAGRRERGIHITEYSGLMASGSVVLSIDSPLPWDPVVANSVGEKLWNAACSSK